MSAIFILKIEIKNKNKKMKNFPKTLSGFYLRVAMRPFLGVFITWFFAFVIMRLIFNVFSPISEKVFISLFEQKIPVGTDFIHFALPTIILLVSIIFIGDLLEIFSNILVSRWRPKMSNHVSEILNNYVHSQSMDFFTNRMAGKINSQVNYVSEGIKLFTMLTSIFGSMLAILLSSGLVLGINKTISIILIGAIILRGVYSTVRMRPMRKASEVSSESSASLSGKLIDSLSNFSIVKLFAARRAEQKYVEPLRKKNIVNKINLGFMQRMFWAIPSIFYTLLWGLMMLLCVKFYVSGEMKVSEIVFTISVYFATTSMISNIVEGIPDLIDMIGSARQSYKDLIKPITVKDDENAPELAVIHGGIEIKNLSFKYKKKMVLNDLSLIIKPGEKIGLVGGSGAGKTTLVNLIMRFYDPTHGQILIDGQNINHVTQDSLRKNIAFIPQEPSMFNRTLRENIGYGEPNATDEQIRQAAERAQADKFIMQSENKYDSLVGDRGIKLSGGQRQRIAIARAFLKNAPILILDEATSALDSETENAIQKSFTELSKGRTTIVIAHRLSTLRNMDRIIVLNGGRVAESGTHNYLSRKKDGIYAKLWKMQSGGFIQE